MFPLFLFFEEVSDCITTSKSCHWLLMARKAEKALSYCVISMSSVKHWCACVQLFSRQNPFALVLRSKSTKMLQ